MLRSHKTKVSNFIELQKEPQVADKTAELELTGMNDESEVGGGQTRKIHMFREYQDLSSLFLRQNINL